MPVLKLIIKTLIVSFISLTAQVADADQGRIIRIIDGDTIVIDYNNARHTVRLIGIDTPESRGGQKLEKDARKDETDNQSMLLLGKQSTSFLTSTAPPGTPITLEFDKNTHDHYGRLLAYVYLPGGEMLNETLLQEGYAIASAVPPNTRYKQEFSELMLAARRKGKGLWAKKARGSEPAWRGDR